MGPVGKDDKVDNEGEVDEGDVDDGATDVDADEANVDEVGSAAARVMGTEKSTAGVDELAADFFE